ncbi:MAG: DUF3604 domain-containing protein [Gammaproteobacteria bacterium]|nr:DUF3604 domain-containing protein [Gammaproteobacteria bacterium]
MNLAEAMVRSFHRGICAALILSVAACSEPQPPPEPPPAEPETTAEEAAAEAPPPTPARTLYWGDTHLHTSYSPDAYLLRNHTADPETAYRYAKGVPVIHPFHRARIQIDTPLDFLVVSDHAEFMGVIPMLLQGDPLVANTETGQRYRAMFAEDRVADVFAELIGMINTLEPAADLNSPEINRTVWNRIMEAADANNEPGEFTAFMGWEWSSTPGGANLHRVIIMRDGKEQGEQFIPYSSFDSARPEDLWNWLDVTSEATGAHFLAIPHNSNISKGLMFPLEDSDGNPITAEYAETRMRWEPIVEITQIKGDSETHPDLSSTDEFADFETYEHIIAVGESFATPDADRSDYVRPALERGLTIAAETGANPYKFGLIGSTDSHTGMSSAEEDNFHGKMALDSTPETKSDVIIDPATGWDMSAAGLAAVWAEENTRAAIFDALERKEVYATTGPRIRVRFFAGWGFNETDLAATDMAAVGYAKGVPMGANLVDAPMGKPPTFLVTAVKDPKEANLDRIQIIKGWLDAKGKEQERIYDIAASDGRTRGPTGLLPVGNTVDLGTASYTNTIGNTELIAVWSDPEFDSALPAFYYVRVLQIPTPRNSLYDSVALGIDHPEGHSPTIQERAYTSPIWYLPK